MATENQTLGEEHSESELPETSVLEQQIEPEVVDIEATEGSTEEEQIDTVYLTHDSEIVALLPGSRMSEARQLGRIFIEAAGKCLQQRPKLHFVLPCVNTQISGYITGELASSQATLPLSIIVGQSREAMAAADVVLVASGTATLEALLLKRPMVVAYRLAPLSYSLLKRLIKIEHYSLPNLLAGKALVPELIQDAVTPENLAETALDYLENPALVSELQDQFGGIHLSLRKGANENAATAVLRLAGQINAS